MFFYHCRHGGRLSCMLHHSILIFFMQIKTATQRVWQLSSGPLLVSANNQKTNHVHEGFFTAIPRQRMVSPISYCVRRSSGNSLRSRSKFTTPYVTLPIREAPFLKAWKYYTTHIKKSKHNARENLSVALRSREI